MRRHTIIGERILLSAPALRPVARLVRSSHERWDGSGYPDGLVGEEIPLGARIVAVCDAFDAMTTDRPYRRKISERAALAELVACAAVQFDPSVVDAFVRALRHDRTERESWLRTGRSGSGCHLVRSGLEPSPGHPQHPLTADGQLRVTRRSARTHGGVMGRPPVDLHHDRAPRQRKSTSCSPRTVLTSGRGRPWAGAALEEEVFQVGAGARAAGVVVGQHRASLP